jgi:hypothetical protein
MDRPFLLRNAPLVTLTAVTASGNQVFTNSDGYCDLDN